MTSRAWVGLAIVAAAVASSARPARSQEEPVPSTRPPEPPGLKHLGLGLDAPVIGVMTSLSDGRPTYGYTVGGALSWEFMPNLLVRAYGSVGRGYGARPRITYTQPAYGQSAADVALTRSQDANWYSAELGGGAAYLWRVPGMDWIPYVGLDAGAAFAGYEFTFASDDPLTQQDTAGGVRPGGTNIHQALAWTMIGTLRAGGRLAMLSRLATQVEIDLSYIPARQHTVSNTYTALGVRSVAENVFQIRSTFGIRFGL